MINNLLYLCLFHIIADFYAQNDHIAHEKKKKYKYVLIHSLQYWAVFLVLSILCFEKNALIVSSITSVCHYSTDTIKYLYTKCKKKRCSDSMLFIFDQAVHFISIVIITYLYRFEICWIDIINKFVLEFAIDLNKTAKLLLVLLLIGKPSNILIQQLLNSYRPKQNDCIIKSDAKAGRLIGTLERLLILILLVNDGYTAIGFVLTAKSLVRYDKITKDPGFSEYYLLGTLLSTLIAIICSTLL